MGIKSDTKPQGCDISAACAALTAHARFASPLTFRRFEANADVPNWILFNVWHEHADEAAVRMAGVDYRLRS